MTDNHAGIDTSAVLDELRDRSRELQVTQWSSTCGAPDCGISAALCDRAADTIEALSAELTARTVEVARLKTENERPGTGTELDDGITGRIIRRGQRNG